MEISRIGSSFPCQTLLLFIYCKWTQFLSLALCIENHCIFVYSTGYVEYFSDINSYKTISLYTLTANINLQNQRFILSTNAYLLIYVNTYSCCAKLKCKFFSYYFRVTSPYANKSVAHVRNNNAREWEKPSWNCNIILWFIEFHGQLPIFSIASNIAAFIV